MLRCTSASLFKKLTVIGGGTMGGGIAQVSATANIPVTIVETADDRIAFSRKTIEISLARIAKKKCNGDEAKMKAFVDETVSRIMWTTDTKAAVSGADLVIEAIVENLDAKKKLFAELDKIAPKGTVFCSNTSSLSITQMASATTRPDRFAGIHFFSPVPMMKLVEVVRTEKVDPNVTEELCAFAKTIGKVPVVCRDTKGFIVNRLLVPYQLEAVRLVERGVASFKDVDTAMKLGCGYPMGPFELSDSAGIDVGAMIVQKWHEEEPENPLFKPVDLPLKLVKAGKLGKKTGEGYYKYDKQGHKLE